MKKLLKWISIILGAFLIIIIIGIVALPFILPLEKIKDIAVAKISETINREVKIKKVSFDIFSGIKLEGLSVSNRKGFADKPFVSADAIALRYAFWPLFKRQIIIKEVRLVKPEILIEKNVRGEFNFSDLTERGRKKAGEAKEGKEEIEVEEVDRGMGFSIVVDSFSIRKGKITYTDYGTKTSSELKNANFSLSGFTLALIRPLNLKFSATANYQGKDIPLSLAGKVMVDLEKESLKIPSLALGVAGEKAKISTTVSKWKTGPSIAFSISSGKLAIDPLLAVLSAGATAPKKEKPKPGELTKTIDRATAGIPSSLSVKGDINIGKISFFDLKADKVDLTLSLASKKAEAKIKEIKFYEGSLSGKASVNLKTSGLSYTGELKLAGFNANPFSNAVVETFLTRLADYKDLTNKVYGTLDADISVTGRGVEVPDIMANAKGSGSFSLKDGEIKRLKTIDAIADKINTPALKQDLKISELTGNFSLKNQIVSIKDLLLKDNDINVKFNGGLDLKNLKYVDGNRLVLRGSPSATQGLSKEFNLLRDEKGWLEATFELKGELKKPIPYPILDKPIEKAVGKVKLKIEAKKVEIEEKAKSEAEKKIEEEKKRLEQEAGEKLKEIFKF